MPNLIESYTPYFQDVNVQQYANQWYVYMQNEWGIRPEMAKAIAIAETVAGLATRTAIGITSGYRSPAYQRTLQHRWDAGQRAGLSSRPATRSWHMQRLAVDVNTRSPGFSTFRDAMLELGCRWGGNFVNGRSRPHFDLPIGPQLSINQLLTTT